MNYRKIPISRLNEGDRLIQTDDIAIESLVKLTVNQEPLANLLASPDNCDDLIIGHLLAEGYINSTTRIDKSNTITKTDIHGTILVDVRISNLEITPSKSLGVTTTSCGACKLDGMELLVNGLPSVKSSNDFDSNILYRGLKEMSENQTGFIKTGGMHCAGLLTHDGKLQFQSEDIGRHNAVDKVIGNGFNQIEFNDSILLLSGRCGWDIVAKAARCNIPTIASIGACSSLAASCARSLGITIHSFVKKNSSVIIG
ncbi:MAG: formate dehydrogenase accessory sulfurtransferase FdhD [Euryarchaeota archaeon]|nr:formate dehydrogenase accessory sulfurtransferase FdhD [Euryarchaeota archaeon]